MLVHCYAGQSRSSTLVMAYLIEREDFLMVACMCKAGSHFCTQAVAVLLRGQPPRLDLRAAVAVMWR